MLKIQHRRRALKITVLVNDFDRTKPFSQLKIAHDSPSISLVYGCTNTTFYTYRVLLLRVIFNHIG